MKRQTKSPAQRTHENVMTKKPAKPDDPEQSKRFIEAAREAEADETEAGADRAFKKVTKEPKPTRRP
jgi:hypothetical protein